MPHYYFHSIDGVDETLDPDGVELSGLAAVERMALQAARDVMAHGVVGGALDLNCRIEVRDESAALVHSLRFPDAIQISPSLL
jgi:hypothetical protein